MFYTLKLRAWLDDSISIVDRKESNLVLKPYYDTKETFIEHHNCMGMCLDEATDLFNATPYPKIRKWLKKKGYEV